MLDLAAVLPQVEAMAAFQAQVVNGYALIREVFSQAGPDEDGVF